MARLGKFTGTIYADDYDFSNCPECCTVISDDMEKDEEAISRHHVNDLLSCLSCFGCPAAQSSKV